MVKDQPLKPPDLTKERSVSVHRGLSLRHCFREGHNVFIFSEVVAFRYFIEFKRKRLAVFHLLLYVLSRWYWYSYACYAVIGTVMQLLLHSGQAGEAPRWPNITVFQHMHKNLWLATWAVLETHGSNDIASKSHLQLLSLFLICDTAGADARDPRVKEKPLTKIKVMEDLGLREPWEKILYSSID